MAEQDDLRGLVAEVAAAYFSNTHVNPTDISNVVYQIAASLASVGAVAVQGEYEVGGLASEPVTKKPTPAQIRKSITHEGLISFEDGKSYKTLKRHLSTKGLTPEDYRAKWGLPKDYPTTSPAYSAARSEMAKTMGLGQMRNAAVSVPATKPRGRRPKTQTALDEPV